MAEVLSRSRGRRGAARLEAAIAEGDFTGPGTRSELENGFISFCARNGFARPDTNTEVELLDGSCEADFVWRPQRFVVETDSNLFHDTPRSMESDRRKDLRLELSGWRYVRCTWRQVTRDDPLLVEAVRRRLAAPLAP